MAHELPDVSALMSEMAAETKPVPEAPPAPALTPAPAAAPASAPTAAPASAPTAGMTQSEIMDDPQLEENVLSAFPGATIADVHQPRKRK